ncbi:MAG: DUF4249 domain-containing protein [Mucilaginibacter sp.]
MQFIKNKYKILVAAILMIAQTSCQKVININVDNAASQLVIEGNITNQSIAQIVKISRSVPFTNTNTFPAVSGATVTVTDNKGNTYKFTESATPGTYTSAKFTGRVGLTYTLSVQINGTTYTGSSTMPFPVNFDQLTYRDNFFNNKNGKLMTVHYQDTPNLPNQYRFIMYVNNVQVNTIFDANDNFTDGGYVDLDLFESDINIVTGDAVTVEMQCIDQNIFTYWFSLSEQSNNNAGGGTTPSNPPSNLNNNALGYFSAHTVQRQTLVIN